MRRRDWLQAMAGASSSLVLGCRQAPESSRTASTQEASAEPANEHDPPRAQGIANGADDDAAPRSLEEDEPRPDEPAAARVLGRVVLQPLGASLSNADVEFVQGALGVFYRVETEVLSPLALPKVAYYPPRSRYRAEKLLDFLQKEGPQDVRAVIGVTSVDISTTKGEYEDWGILGLATVSGGHCVVSRFRAKRGAQSEQHTRERLAKTVVHEVGHNFGLRHCPTYGCLMEDGKGTVKTTDHEYDLCDDCRGQLGEWVRPRAERPIPWDDPR